MFSVDRQMKQLYSVLFPDLTWAAGILHIESGREHLKNRVKTKSAFLFSLNDFQSIPTSAAVSSAQIHWEVCFPLPLAL